MLLLWLVGLEEGGGSLFSMAVWGGTESEEGIDGSMVATGGVFWELRAL